MLILDTQNKHGTSLNQQTKYRKSLVKQRENTMIIGEIL